MAADTEEREAIQTFVEAFESTHLEINDLDVYQAVYRAGKRDAEQPQRSRWIPITERLPEPRILVALLVNDTVELGWLFPDGWRVRNSTLAREPAGTPTHWTPLPGGSL